MEIGLKADVCGEPDASRGTGDQGDGIVGTHLHQPKIGTVTQYMISR